MPVVAESFAGQPRHSQTRGGHFCGELVGEIAQEALVALILLSQSYVALLMQDFKRRTAGNQAWRLVLNGTQTCARA